MIGQDVGSKPGAFQDMASLVLDVGLFTSEFGLCGAIAEYLADLVAQSHEDPARYANFSSLLINEMIELAFRSAMPTGRIDFNLFKNDACVRACISFGYHRNDQAEWHGFGTPPPAASPQNGAQDLIMLAQAIGVGLCTETGANDHVTLTADFFLGEGVR